MTVFRHYAQYYDLLYRDKDYPAEAAFVAQLLERHAPAAKAVLELGCGTGLHAVSLAELGYAVHGIDVSSDMVERAAARRDALGPPLAAGLTFAQADIRDFASDKKYDAAISLFHVISYQTSNDDLLRAFATVKSCVRSGGVFLFDCWYGPAVLKQRPETRIKRWESDGLRIVRFAEPVWHPNANCVDVNYHILAAHEDDSLAEVREKHTMRYLFVPEVELLLRSVGLSLAWHGEWLTGHALGADSWNACFVARVP